MALPGHIFSIQDHLFLDDNNDDNLRKIKRFNPEDGKLALILLESFKIDNLLLLFEAFSLAIDKWGLRNFW